MLRTITHKHPKQSLPGYVQKRGDHFRVMCRKDSQPILSLTMILMFTRTGVGSVTEATFEFRMTARGKESVGCLRQSEVVLGLGADLLPVCTPGAGRESDMNSLRGPMYLGHTPNQVTPVRMDIVICKKSHPQGWLRCLQCI